MISLIVAYDKHKCIGKNGKLGWSLKDDLLNVKKLTTNQTILMGRKTYASIGKPLPNRINKVLTTNKNTENMNNLEFYFDYELAIKNYKTEKLFIFGGETIYNIYLPYCNELFITKVNTVINGDTFFPDINLNDFELLSKKHYNKDDNNEYSFITYHYIKKKLV